MNTGATDSGKRKRMVPALAAADWQADFDQLDLPPEVEVPPGDVLDTLLRFWSRSTQ